MAEVYPKIKEYCREKHGLEFQVNILAPFYLTGHVLKSFYIFIQVVDMRWGVRDEATDDHMTTELCMREIANCQRLSMGPNFVVCWIQFIFRRSLENLILSIFSP